MGSSESKPVALTPASVPEMTEKHAILDDQRRRFAGGASDTLDLAQVAQWDKSLKADATFTLAQLVLQNADPWASLKSRTATIADEKVFNLDLRGPEDKERKYPGPVTNQGSSGRCWLFATCNVLRYNVVEMLKLGDFELSQAYLHFWDKLEKANYFLENVLELTDEPIEGRLMSFLSQAPVNDGGQWDMAYNLLEKYGMVPKAIYPESFTSSATSRLNWIVTAKLREYALTLRKEAANGASVADLRSRKNEFVAEIYSTMCITYGTPPRPDAEFTWDYYDKDKKFHSYTGTPLEFYAAYGRRKGMDPREAFSLINDPRNEYEKLYSVKRLGNVWGAPDVKYVNAPIEVLEDAVIAGIKANTPLFYGCDVGKFSDRAKGIMDTALYDMSAAYGFGYGMNKAERLLVGESQMTHAMVITAVHVGPDGRPVRYKVENSWSDTMGEKGWYMMSADWFREFVYQIVVPRSIVDKKWVKVLDQEPTWLEPWDPMGALA